MVKLINIYKSYPHPQDPVYKYFPFLSRNKREVLKGVNMHVNKGEIYGITGENGSGKTTLLKIIAMILLPDKGKVVITPMVQKKNIKTWRRIIGYSPSSDKTFIPRLTVYENLKFFSLLQGNGKKIEKILDLFFLTPYKDTPFFHLSQGYKERLGVARVLLDDPFIILLDEPARSMDNEGIENLINILKGFKKENRTIILTSQREEILKGCDRIGKILNGRLKDDFF